LEKICVYVLEAACKKQDFRPINSQQRELTMAKSGGIIRSELNPFACDDWIEQGFGLTDHRKNQLAPLLGLDLQKIEKLNRNEGRYPAFVAVRWGFAEVKNNRLMPTYKWKRKNLYDEYGT